MQSRRKGRQTEKSYEKRRQRKKEKARGSQWNWRVRKGGRKWFDRGLLRRTVVETRTLGWGPLSHVASRENREGVARESLTRGQASRLRCTLRETRVAVVGSRIRHSLKSQSLELLEDTLQTILQP
ncbi:hypothetical protein VNO78_12168 [Psophocarpus tetragonolobus]|uniref:Uncharacterized protein n=1 Tax=Psophocarpus tetragonolobus TaxID=3891 RepID=A0AAN9SQ98_PSOTE